MTVLRGKVSWFGGPHDTGVAPDEGLAFIYRCEQAPHLFLPEQPPGTTGLARRLNPAVYFIACRWDYDETSKADLLDMIVRVRAPKTGREFSASPADWGPHKSTDRVADISQGLMAALGIETDDEVEVTFRDRAGDGEQEADMATLAPTLVILRDAVNVKYPGRSKSSDGWIGDPAHAARKSDHNPNSKGVVRAIDITHDPRSGCDAHALGDIIRQRKDARLRYIISNRRIAEAKNDWKWAKYSGSNPHDKHVHFSAAVEEKLYGDKSPWDLSAVPVEPDVTAPPVSPLLRLGSHGDAVATAQGLLNKHGARPALDVDSDFGGKTETAVKAFQRKAGLEADGWVGPYTWEELRK